jgi:hypothetical protein
MDCSRKAIVDKEKMRQLVMSEEEIWNGSHHLAGGQVQLS